MTRRRLALLAATLCAVAAGCPGPGGTSDTSPPTVPAAVFPVPATASSIRVGWQSSTDDAGVAGYRVYRDGALVASVSGSTLEVVDRGLQRSTTYCYAVAAVDAAGNASARSLEACGTTPPFTLSTVDATAGVGAACSIAVDAADHVHIAYYDPVNRGLQYATDRSGSWTTSAVSAVGSRGSGGTAIAVDPGGSAHIAFQADGAVKYATDASGAWVTSTVAAGTHYGALALDPSDKARIGYVGVDGPAVASNTTGDWTSTAVEPGTCCGATMALALDADGGAHVAYARGSDGSLRYATDRSGSFVPTPVDVGGWAAQIAVDAGATAHLAYYDWSRTNLTYATNGSGTWAAATVQNLGHAGYWLSFTLDAAGHAHVTTASMPRGVYYSTNRSGSWVSTPIDAQAAGAYAGNGVAVDRNGDVHVCYAAPGGLVHGVTR